MKSECCDDKSCCEESSCEDGTCSVKSCNDNCCDNNCCCSESTYDDPGMMAKEIYDKAMMDMVKDRVKKRLELTHANKADKLADLVFEYIENWKAMKAVDKKRWEWESKVMEIMNE